MFKLQTVGFKDTVPVVGDSAFYLVYFNMRGGFGNTIAQYKDSKWFDNCGNILKFKVEAYCEIPYIDTRERHSLHPDMRSLNQYYKYEKGDRLFFEEIITRPLKSSSHKISFTRTGKYIEVMGLTLQKIIEAKRDKRPGVFYKVIKIR